MEKESGCVKSEAASKLLMGAIPQARHCSKMLHMLIEEAREKGVTEISLDTTESGRPLYKRMGVEESEECMVLNI